MNNSSNHHLQTIIQGLIFQIRAESAATRLLVNLRQMDILLRKAGYRPDQPRDAAGTATGGQWAASTANAVDRIVAAARRIHVAAFSQKYSLCIDLCYPLLERPQPAGSDFNLWTFHSCLNRCLGK